MSPPLPPALLAPEPGPATLKTRRWGGSRLAALRNAPANVTRPIGESWEFSTLPDSESRSGGMPLIARLGRPLPFLAKLLDTALPLSIQVHPNDDEPAGTLGKEEAWVVLEANPGAVLVAGVRPGVDGPTFAAAVRRAVLDPTQGAALIALLQEIPARVGTVVLVPAGTVHAVGRGILLAEIQQPTDRTYRLFDYGSGRELHTEQALAAVRIAAQPIVSHHGPAQGDGSAAPRLQGKHLHLEILGNGRWQRDSRSDELLIAYGAACLVHCEGETHRVPAGDLRLITPAHRYTVEVADGGGAVIGAIAAQAT